MRDVARSAGVHPGTVSRVLNPTTRRLVNPTTADRVDRAARELGYALNPIARGLKTKRTFSIGVVIPDLTNPLFPPIIRGMEEVFDRAGYSALVASTDGDPARERQRMETLIARQVDGLLIATAARHHPLVSEVISSGLAVVLVNRTVEGRGAFAVVPDDRKGSALAVGHLADLGHRRIGHLAGPGTLSTGLLRMRGFLEAMEDRGLAVDRRLIVHADAFTERAGAEAAGRLFADGRPPTAVVAANDLLALGVYQVLAEHGLRCPEDVSVVGFNDMPFADRFSPPLSTIHIPASQIGERAAELLLERIDNPDAIPQTLVFEPTLKQRASTGPPRTGRSRVNGPRRAGSR